MLIKNGRIFDAVHEEPYTADILVEDGKIKAIGTGFTDEDVFDAEGFNVYPGWVDAHSHLGLSGYGIGYEGHDYNEMSDICTPQLRGIDSFNPLDPSVHKAALAGVTTIAVGPGSANAIGGTWAAIKPVGVCADDMIVKDPVAMKGALGENPKRVYRERGASARMSTIAHMRNLLFRTRDYLARKEAANGDITRMPAFDMKLEAMIPVIRKELPLKIHAHQANDILGAIRVAKEFDVRMTIEHVTEGHLIADKLAENKQYMLAVGPTFTDASKFELRNKSWETAGILADKGCHVCIITDHPFALEYSFPLYAGMAAKAGMKRFDALKAITINAAEHLGIEDRVGSIEPGKDADINIYEGDPLETTGRLIAVFIDGKRVEE
ncbi:MAG: amidohydrolase [Solobacterium sp.]|nr:amidohydrolase [Solobacterium sp.]MBR2727490.1 amidohydrolase [Solobacterium sp.]